MTDKSTTTQEKPIYYWALAIDVKLDDGYRRLDTGFIATRFTFGPDYLEKIEAALPSNEKVMDYVGISEEIFNARPGCFISKDGWVDLNPEVFHRGGTKNA